MKTKTLKTRGGATVRLSAGRDGGQMWGTATCEGCGDEKHRGLDTGMNEADALAEVRPWAQSHAETCRGS